MNKVAICGPNYCMNSLILGALPGFRGKLLHFLSYLYIMVIQVAIFVFLFY